MSEHTEQRRRVIHRVSDAGTTEIVYTEESPCGEVDHVVRSAQPPRDDFAEAMRGLIPHAVRVASLPPKWADAEADTHVTQVNITHTMDILGAEVTLQHKAPAAGSPVKVVVPHQAERPYSEAGDTAVCMSPEYAEAVRAVERAALDYLDCAGEPQLTAART